MGRAKTQHRRAGGRKPVSADATAREHPAGLSQYSGTEDRDGTVQLPKDTTERAARVVKWLP